MDSPSECHIRGIRSVSCCQGYSVNKFTIAVSDRMGSYLIVFQVVKMAFSWCVYTLFFGLCCLQLYHVNCDSSTIDLSVLSNFLKYIDALIHRVLEVLEIDKTGNPGPVDCAQVLKNGNTKSGNYRIWPLNWKAYGSFRVYCDMDSDGGGWTVIQRRGDYQKPQDYFFKTWAEYQRGFGDLNQDFWLGNDRIFSLTNQGNYSLRIELTDKEGERRFAFFNEFWIESERHDYVLHVTGYSGNAGDSFSYMNGMKFSTKDRDNDASESDCADKYKGGWWYKKCHLSNLNGLYLNGNHASFAEGIEWHAWRGYNYSFPSVDMKIMPH